MGFFSVTDVKEEEIEEIRLLEAEKVISIQAERQIIFIFRTLWELKAYLKDMPKRPDSSSMGRLVDSSLKTFNKILVPHSSLAQEGDEIQRLLVLAEKVVGLITNIESEQSKIRNKLSGKRRKSIDKARNLEENEKKGMMKKLEYLRKLPPIFLNISKKIEGIQEYLKAAKESCIQEQRNLNLKNPFQYTKSWLNKSKEPAEEVREDLKKMLIIIEDFKRYLTPLEEQAKLASRFERHSKELE